MASSPLFHLFEPTLSMADAAVEAASDAPFSYTPVGATAGPLPEGFDHDVQRQPVGAGVDDWERAKAAIRSWKQFDLPWVRFYHPEMALLPGAVVVFAARPMGLWTLNLCRIVSVFDESDASTARFGLSYGTLEGHSVSGEERFELSWDHRTDDVFFEIRKFSQFRHWLVRASAPVARRIQAKFSREAIDSVRRAVSGERGNRSG